MFFVGRVILFVLLATPLAFTLLSPIFALWGMVLVETMWPPDKAGGPGFKDVFGGLSGCPRKNGETVHKLKPTDTAAVRCCSKDGDTCASKHSGCFSSAKTLEDAKNQCAGAKMRLCTKKEVLSSMCCGTGCGYDSKIIWFYEFVRGALSECARTGKNCFKKRSESASRLGAGGGSLLSAARSPPDYDESYDGGPAGTASRRLLQTTAAATTAAATAAATAAGGSTAAATTAAKTAAATTGPPTFHPSTAPPSFNPKYNIENHTDYPGHDLDHGQVGSPGECGDFCKETEGCCFFTYKPVVPRGHDNCWAKPYLKDHLSKRMENQPNHIAGHFSDGKCSHAHQHGLKHKGDKCKAAGQAMRFWVILTTVLACALSALLCCVGLASVFRDRDEELMMASDEDVVWPVPVLKTFLEQTRDSKEAWEEAESMLFTQVGGNFNALFFFNTSFSVLFDLWVAGMVLLLIMSGNCGAHIPDWYAMLWYVGGIVASGALTLLYGWHRYLWSYSDRYHVHVAPGSEPCCGRYFDGQCAVHGVHGTLKQRATAALPPQPQRQFARAQRTAAPHIGIRDRAAA